MSETNYTYARAHLAELWDRAVGDREPVVIHCRGAEDVALISAEELSGMQETLYLLASPEHGIRLLTALKRAYARGKGRPLAPDDPIFGLIGIFSDEPWVSEEKHRVPAGG